MPKKIAIALSGGVDSSVSAYLLKKAQADLTAVYIRFYARNESEKQRIDEEEKLAKKVAEKLEIKFEVLDFSKLQEEKVVNYFLDAYQNGLSPNPCLECNRLLKFGEFYNWALEKGFDKIATGHYAQIIESNSKYYLSPAHDKNKDQSYFLYQLAAEQLDKIIFPLGKLLKTQVRQIAKEQNLISKKSKESFDICFLNQTTPKAFLEKRLGNQPGELVDKLGNIIGTHQGAHLCTVGQRQGFSVNHRLLKESSIKFDQENPPALFVIGKNMEKNQLVLGIREECFGQEFIIKKVHFITKETGQQKKIFAQVKVRNTGKLVNCQIENNEQSAIVKLKEKIFALAPGQAAVFYQQLKDEMIVLGGGKIS